MNPKDRVKKFQKMFAGSSYAKGDTGEAPIVDLIADALHFAVSQGWDHEAILRMAGNHVIEESSEAFQQSALGMELRKGRLVSWLKKQGETAVEAIDDIVHDVFSEGASSLNNEGIAAQINVLVAMGLDLEELEGRLGYPNGCGGVDGPSR